jgi:hypothetical protein
VTSTTRASRSATRPVAPDPVYVHLDDLLMPAPEDGVLEPVPAPVGPLWADEHALAAETEADRRAERYLVRALVVAVTVVVLAWLLRQQVLLDLVGG